MVLDNKTSIRCLKCGELAYKVMIIQNRGYGSELDCFTENTLIPVCHKCSVYLRDEWFYEEPVMVDEYTQEYPNEHKIMHFMKTLSA